jgi:hypothetical protein
MGRTSRGEDVAGGATKRVSAHLAARLCRRAGVLCSGITGPLYRQRAIEAGMDLLQSVGYGTDEGAWLQLGVGVNKGVSIWRNLKRTDARTVVRIGESGLGRRLGRLDPVKAWQLAASIIR